MSSADSPGVRVIVALRNGFAQIADDLTKILEEMAPPETRSALGIPKIDIADLNAADWTSYATKKEAKDGEAGWLKNPAHFTSYEPPQVVFELVKALTKSKGHRLVLGDMEYFFSGEKKFLSRRPAKKESAK